MSKEYRYRKHIRWGQYVSPVICFICCSGMLVTPLFCLMHESSASLFKVLSEELLAQLSILYLVLFLEIFLFGILLWYVSYRQAGVCVSFDDEGVIYRYRGSEQRIEFNDMSRIVFPSSPCLDGWLKIVSPNATIRLTVLLEGIDDFLLELKAALDSRELSDRYDRARFFRFLKAATYLDQSWARLYSVWWKVVLLTLLNAAVGYVFFIFGLETVWWIVLSAGWPLVVWGVVEIIFMRRVAKLSVEESFTCPPRDLAYERAVNRKAVLLGALFYLAISIIILILTLL